MTRSHRAVDYSGLQSLPEIWPIVAEKFGSITALQDPHSQPPIQVTYHELYQQIQQFAAGLQALGLEVGEHVALFADNSPRWIVADQGIMLAGAADAVRGSQADRAELLFILSHSDSSALIIHDLATLKRLVKDEPTLPVRFLILLTDETPPEMAGIKTLNFSQVMAIGQEYPLQSVALQPQDLATLMYTSGTSGMPKGVMLTHSNLLAQVIACPQVVQPEPGDRVLSILPIWHAYERSFEYFVLSQGCSQAYTNIRHVKKDIKQFRPQYMVAVPRLWESIHEGIQKQFRDQPAKKQALVNFFLTQSQQYLMARRTWQRLDLNDLNPSPIKKLLAGLQMLLRFPIHRLGDRLVYRKIRDGLGGAVKFFVSGGGSIADYLEDFFELVGVNILGGYGLTETSPITNVRRPDRNLRGADGQPVANTEIRIVHPETRQPLPVGQQGLVMIRGHQVMQGYYKNPEATRKAIDPEGWFDSGDLGMVTADDDLIITGRAKDTIVLTNGENIEPQPIEDACLRSPYLDQMMLVGQDQKTLGALIVPNLDALQQWANAQGIQFEPTALESPTRWNLQSKAIQDLIRQELVREVQQRPGYRPDDRIGVFRLLTEPMTVENGMLTQTLKVRRNIVMEHYQGMINEMFMGSGA